MRVSFSSGGRARKRIEACLGPILIALTFLVLCIISWRRWTDPVIDVGRELYTFWQLAEGKTLYRELEHLYGPFSSCFNAFVFRLGGVSYMTLVWANLALLGGFTALLYGIWRRLTDRWSATCVVLGFLSVSAFGMYRVDLGNYNFITPYSHEAVHGLYLAAGVLVCLTAQARQPRVLLQGAAGFLYGLVFLTKSEVFLALNVAVLAYSLAGWRVGRRPWRDLGVLAGWLLAGLVVAAAGVYVLMPGRLSVPEYLVGISRQYVLGFNPALTGSRFYRTILGLDQPGVHLLDMVRAAAVMGLVGLLFHRLGRWAASIQGPTRRGVRGLMMAAGLGLGVLLYFWDWHYLACLLPPVLGVALVREVRLSRVQAGDDPHLRERWGTTSGWVLWLGFGLGMLFKSGLSPVFVHYGFGLSAVGLMGLIALVTYRVPGFYPLPMRSVMRLWLTALLLVGCCRLAQESWSEYARRTCTVGLWAGDQFRFFAPDLDERGRIMNELTAWVAAETSPRATLAVIPEGVMLNYLTRRVNPNPSINFMVVSMAAYGESRMVSTFQANPPDYVVFLDRDLTEYGLPAFGTPGSPGAALVRWVESNYRVVQQVRRLPRITIYRRAKP